MTVLRQFGVLGKRLDYSHSPAWFAERFRKQGITDAAYLRFERDDLAGLDEWLEQMRQSDVPLLGLNVTVPYKQAILPLLAELTDEARAVGAVNAIKPRIEGGWIGHNTDVEGFLKSLRPFLRSEHDRALILGSGGAAAAVRHGLQSLGVEVVHVTRKPHAWNSIRYADLNPLVLSHFKLIVQCTPVGTHPAIHESVPFPWEGLSPAHLVMDLIYNPTQTEFLKRSAAAGAETLNGKDMLYAQAEAAWIWWNSPN